MKWFLPVLLLLVLCALSHEAFATEEYGERTGKTCAACHVDPSGGGELTAEGEAYEESLAAQLGEGAGKGETAASLAAKGVRLVTGYLHLLTAILWFGTILYVHLVLKPSYAAGGLPKGEVRVGVLGMVVMGVTGALLTHYRVGSLDVLHTRFGILLLVKIGLYLVMVLSAIFVVLFIGPRLKRKDSGGVQANAGSFSPQELAYFDGKEGRPAYFAYQGSVYEASGSKLWKGGSHMARHQAGSDLTEALRLAPHGEELVTALKRVGEMAGAGGKPPLHERVFYSLAYMNLSLVFAIVLIVALWRWW